MSASKDPKKPSFVSFMDAEMTRHEFLRYMLAVMLGLFGITRFVDVLKNTSPNPNHRVSSRGYGGGAYGD